MAPTPEGPGKGDRVLNKTRVMAAEVQEPFPTPAADQTGAHGHKLLSDQTGWLEGDTLEGLVVPSMVSKGTRCDLPVGTRTGQGGHPPVGR